MKNTSLEYDNVVTICRTLFINKMKDYGSAWRILRLPSLTDQIFIKAQRIRSLQENEVRKVDEDEKFIKYMQEVIFRKQDQTTKNAGVYSGYLNNWILILFHPIIEGPNIFNQFKRAKNAEKYIYTTGDIRRYSISIRASHFKAGDGL